MRTNSHLVSTLAILSVLFVHAPTAAEYIDPVEKQKTQPPATPGESPSDTAAEEAAEPSQVETPASVEPD